MEEESEAFQRGLMQGQVDAIEKMVHDHGETLKDHNHRFRYIERILWGMIGALLLVQGLPIVKTLIEAFGK